MSVAVIGVLRQPREGPQYKRLRKATNQKLCIEVLKIKAEWMNKKNGNISFIDTDGSLNDKLFARDGVYLNPTGNEKM